MHSESDECECCGSRLVLRGVEDYSCYHEVAVHVDFVFLTAKKFSKINRITAHRLLPESVPLLTEHGFAA
jgi:hypothetical protein